MLSFHVEKNHLCRQNWQKHDSSTEIFLTPLPWLLMVHHLANANSSSFAANYTTRQKHEDDGIQWAAHALRTGALILLFEKKNQTEISQRVLYVWKPFEHKEFSCYILFCPLKCFFFTATLSDKMSSKKWISRCLFTMLPWRHKVNALWLVHSKTKGPFGITS